MHCARWARVRLSRECLRFVTVCNEADGCRVALRRSEGRGSRSREQIPLATDGLDELRILRVVAQQFAQPRDAHVD